MVYKDKEKRRLSHERYNHSEKGLLRNLRQKPRVTLCKYNTKVRVFTHYGNGKLACVCCGESMLAFLSIDHIAGNGADERRNIKQAKFGGYHFYQYLIKNGFPEGYQTLCFNCNLGKGSGKMCPHKLDN